MRVPAIYLETTIFNFPFADDAPHYKADALRLFAEIKAGKFKPFTSKYVLEELDGTKDKAKAARMKALVADCGAEVLPEDDDTVRLADMYIEEGIIPERYATDALHIAAASVAGLDCVVSLNFQHIVKRSTMIRTEVVNAREGYRRVYIHTPAEVISHDENA